MHSFEQSEKEFTKKRGGKTDGKKFYDPNVEKRGKKEGIIEGILEFLQVLGEVPSNITKHINKNVIILRQFNK